MFAKRTHKRRCFSCDFLSVKGNVIRNGDQTGHQTPVNNLCGILNKRLWLVLGVRELPKFVVAEIADQPVIKHLDRNGGDVAVLVVVKSDNDVLCINQLRVARRPGASFIDLGDGFREHLQDNLEAIH